MSEREIELIVEDCNTSLLDLAVQEIDRRKQILRPPKLDLSSSNMATPVNPQINVPNKNEVQILLNSIPEFYPDQNLAIFVNEVDNLCAHLNNRLTQDLVYVVNFSIRSKIKGEAREFISYQGANEWPDIRKALLSKYGDQRSEELLVSGVSQCVQKKNEDFMDFYSRVLKAGNALMQNVTLNTPDVNILAFKKSEYSKLALKTFKNGILEPYRSFLSHFDLNSIEECITKCRTLDNQNKEWEYSEFLRRSTGSGSSLTAPELKPTNNLFKLPPTVNPVVRHFPPPLPPQLFQNCPNFTFQQPPSFIKHPYPLPPRP